MAELGAYATLGTSNAAIPTAPEPAASPPKEYVCPNGPLRATVDGDKETMTLTCNDVESSGKPSPEPITLDMNKFAIKKGAAVERFGNKSMTDRVTITPLTP